MTIPVAIAAFGVAAVLSGILQAFVGYSFRHWVVSTAFGVGGVLFGRWVSLELDLPLYWLVHLQGEQFPVVWSVLGAALFLSGLEQLRFLRWKYLG